MIPPRTAISIGLRVIPSSAGLAHSRSPGRRVKAPVFQGHGRPKERRKESDYMDKLLEYTLNQYQQRIDRLKELTPNTVVYENLFRDIDSLQEKLDQIRRQIVESKH